MLPTDYQTFIAVGHYSKIYENGHRETWPEIVERYVTFVTQGAESIVNVDELSSAIINCEVMPSMRAMLTAGEAANRDPTCIYNCAYLEIDKLRRFAEVLYILMSGTGIGFSCELRVVSQLPPVPLSISSCSIVHVIADSKQGWCDAFLLLMEHLWHGEIPHFDYSQIRPAGAPLKVMGGRASGPDPLRKLFGFVIALVQKARGRQLRPKEVHDIMCNIAEITTVGGVRRSALISLSDLDDEQMRTAKSGEWWKSASWLSMSNNSAVYESKPIKEVFAQEWQALHDSLSGERGIFNREANVRLMNKQRRNPSTFIFGTNPCSEIVLRPFQFCNLTEVIVRSTDTPRELVNKVRLATILGTLQSRFVNFPFLSPEWKRNCEEERLLGVSLSGICDNALLSDHSGQELPHLLSMLRTCAIQINAIYARLLNINCSAAITCVKPSGTVSQLVDCASGIHPRFSQYYVRTVRIDKKDPLYKFMKEQGVACEDEKMHPENTAVLSFPMCAPRCARLRNSMSAMDQLQLWLVYQKYWCEHKPSCTVYIRENEWTEVRDWLYEHFDYISGLSFLPYDNGIYPQAPYQEISQERYEEMCKTSPVINWSKLQEYDRAHLNLFQRGRFVFACSANGCEIVDMV
jgi:ribonucleoside-diphosphate reductase alpha chain